MNIIGTTKRLILGLALPGLLFMGTGAGFAYDKDANSATTIAARGEKQRSARVVKKPACAEYWCKALRAKGLCSSGSVLCRSCGRAERTPMRRPVLSLWPEAH